ncbi:MAG: hypothetical protein Ct9H300mP16_07680 [Pseudomonadota bacterium]|nr:MAG: hypothetical protein Ct9H300mP16_07680 [Pseudomonadota bacterium]
MKDFEDLIEQTSGRRSAKMRGHLWYQLSELGLKNKPQLRFESHSTKHSDRILDQSSPRVTNQA